MSRISLESFSLKFLSKKIVFAMDTLLSLFASVFLAVVAFFLNIGDVESRLFNMVWGLSSLSASFLAFYLFKTYSVIIRHFAFKDTIRYGGAVLLKVILMWLVIAIMGLISNAALVMLILDLVLTLMLLCAVRLLMIVVYEGYRSKLREGQNRENILVYGVNDKSIATVVRLADSKHYKILGFISPDVSLRGTIFSDKQVYTLNTFENFKKAHQDMILSGVLFSTEKDLRQEQNRLVAFCSKLGVKVLLVPSIDEPGLLQNAGMNIRQVKIEDLLGREEIKIPLEAINKFFGDKTVLVTGAAGSIGSELCRQLAGFGIRKLVLFDNAETPMHNLRLELNSRFPLLDAVAIVGDVRMPERLNYVFRDFKPNVVFHAAAYKHVPLMEENPCEAVLVNVCGSRNVADKCIEYGVEKMVMISTDKAVNPTNIMGCTKRLAEIYVQSLGQAVSADNISGKTKFVTTRFGNVLGSNGSVIPLFRDQIAKGGPVTVTDKEITRFFMTIPEASRLVMEAASLQDENSICLFDMGEPVKIDTLARRMIELTGLKPDEDIKIVYTGLRPGEKLYEEVLAKAEDTDPTVNEKIRIARVRKYDYDLALKAVEELESYARSIDIPNMVKLMKKTVPEYISNNSRFEIFDKTS